MGAVVPPLPLLSSLHAGSCAKAKAKGKAPRIKASLVNLEVFMRPVIARRNSAEGCLTVNYGKRLSPEAQL